ncbi:MAG TPA: hypothetical protein VM491_18625 [Burkholderiaceae bacterium]|nr:hypothetical protein [Burkholderiaceae bacterium]
MRHWAGAMALAAAPSVCAAADPQLPRSAFLHEPHWAGLAAEYSTGLRFGPAQPGALHGWDVGGSWRVHGSLGLVAPRIGCNGASFARSCGPRETVNTQSAREYALQIVLSRIRSARAAHGLRATRADEEDDRTGRWKMSVNRKRLTVRYEIRF